MPTEHSAPESIALMHRRLEAPSHTREECRCKMCIHIETLFMTAKAINDGIDPRNSEFAQGLTRYIYGFEQGTPQG